MPARTDRAPRWRTSAGAPSLDGLEIEPFPQGSKLELRVRPSARVARIEGVHGGALKVSVTAAPEKGKANQEVERLLAAVLGLPRSSVAIVAGHGSRNKVVAIAGLVPSDVRARLEPSSLVPSARRT